MKSVKVIILDDSLLMRESLSQELMRDVNVKVVAKVASAVDARDKIVEFLPDILISEMVLSEMSGIDFIRKLLPQYYLPVIMMNADASLEGVARRANAVAFVPKPAPGGSGTAGGSGAHDLFYRQMLARVKMIVSGDRGSYNIASYASSIVAIGASTGGAEAIETVLKGLPAVTPPVVIAQHMPAKFTGAFAARMNALSALSVKEAEEGDLLIPGQAYVAPGGVHTLIKKSGERFYISLRENAHHNRPCPSIDLMFRSVAEAAGGRSIGVLLTGMGKDGAEGLKHMHNAGAKTIGQDEETSVVYGMPKAAFENGSVDYQVPIGKAAQKIQALLGR